MAYRFKSLFAELPLIGIFRGIKADEAVSVVGAAIEKGLCIVEVPLNSPEPLDSIARLAERFGERVLVGAGTVTTVAEVEAVAQAGGRLIVTPYARREVVERAKELGLAAVPGALTPTEIADMHAAGADAVKIFPAEMMPPRILKGLGAVLPPDLLLVPVGGVSLENMADYVAAGAAGFGLGSALYRAGDRAETVAARAAAFVVHLQCLLAGPTDPISG